MCYLQLFSWKFPLEPETTEPSQKEEKQKEQADLTSTMNTPATPANYEMNAVKKQESPHLNATISSSLKDAITDVLATTTTTNNSTANNVIAFNSSKEHCQWDHKVIYNHTLVGGINAGDFREHVKVSTMDGCMDQCCQEPDCDLSFMIDKDCYTVKCLKDELCETRQAKATSFVPKIAYKKKSNDVESKFFFLQNGNITSPLMHLQAVFLSIAYCNSYILSCFFVNCHSS